MCLSAVLPVKPALSVVVTVVYCQLWCYLLSTLWLFQGQGEGRWARGRGAIPTGTDSTTRTGWAGSPIFEVGARQRQGSVLASLAAAILRA